MKVTINGKVNPEALKVSLNEQKQKCKAIDEFCKENKMSQLFYKDSELEYEYEKSNVKLKVETRHG
ncbi:hypothetical protein [Liberiplasma polymorphum]|uniref:hypothetical protein n=1 Tax=Liberiplasma polymorphum TaxID=3374570 RepID=UPI0037750E61